MDLNMTDGQHANGGAFPKQGHGKLRAVTESDCVGFRGGEIIGSRQQVWYMDHAAVDDGSSGHEVTTNRQVLGGGYLWNRPVGRNPFERIALNAEKGGIAGITEARRAFNDRIQDRLQVHR